MSEYWKSTPSYWCKFCSIYVRDTGIERKNHESSIKHQNNIQRSLRELHRGQEREKWEKQRAKDEVARLNGLVGGNAGSDAPKASRTAQTAAKPPALPAPKLSSAQQRKAHAEQLAALGVELPEELKKEVSGVGSWQVVSERVIAPEENAGGRSLADIKREAEENKEGAKYSVDAVAQGVHKRKLEDDEDTRDEETGPKRKAWGSNFKSHPASTSAGNDEDLDVLLSGVSKRKEPEVKTEVAGAASNVKQELDEEGKPISTSAAASAAAETPKDTPSSVVFKKRKGKK